MIVIPVQIELTTTNFLRGRAQEGIIWLKVGETTHQGGYLDKRPLHLTDEYLVRDVPDGRTFNISRPGEFAKSIRRPLSMTSARLSPGSFAKVFTLRPLSPKNFSAPSVKTFDGA